MEPSDTDPAPRPKGFVRRNWGAVSMIVCLGAFSRMQLNYTVATSTNTLSFYVDKGNASVAYDDVSLSFDNWFAWATPALGTVPKLHFNATSMPDGSGWSVISPVFQMTIPIWLPVGCLVIRVLFREWRRKRAAKGKACQQ
jgi:hypothetical protein